MPSDVTTISISTSARAGGTGSISILFDDLSLRPYGTKPCLLDRCEGDCDKDEDCLDDLECFHREVNGINGHFGAVPGCSGIGTNNRDYCYDPTHSNQECVYDPLSGCSGNGVAWYNKWMPIFQIDGYCCRCLLLFPFIGKFSKSHLLFLVVGGRNLALYCFIAIHCY